MSNQRTHGIPQILGDQINNKNKIKIVKGNLALNNYPTYKVCGDWWLSHGIFLQVQSQ
jgi:hypothetical protein